VSAADVPVVEFLDVHKRLGGVPVLDGVDLALPRGVTSVIVGPSGSGKTTLVRLMVGLIRPDRGQVRVAGEDVAQVGRRGLMALRQQFGMLFQDGALFHALTVAQNVMFPLHHHARVPLPEMRQRADEALAEVGLQGLGDRRVDQLSGGQRKRVALARALVLRPEIVVFDEPTAGLDPVTSAAIEELILGVRERHGLTFIVITHDTATCRRIADRVGMLWEGRIRVWGPRDDVLTSADPVVRQFLDRQSQGPIKVS
jgi:phospholipid/cholesterol/gamma-HCH transport system ATP-binding protein